MDGALEQKWEFLFVQEVLEICGVKICRFSKFALFENYEFTANPNDAKCKF